MKKFSIREVETLKTTAALYSRGCPGPGGPGVPVIHQV